MIAGIVLAIASLVYEMMLLYQFWKLIPEDIARTTPGKAVGFTFIPYFNVYWFFVAYMGLGEDMNKTLRQRGFQYKVNKQLGMILCICAAIGFVLPFLVLPDIASLVILIYFVKSVLGGATVLIEGREQMAVITENTPANTVTPRQSATVPPASPSTMTIEIIIDGTAIFVTKKELFDLVTNGSVREPFKTSLA